MGNFHTISHIQFFHKKSLKLASDISKQQQQEQKMFESVIDPGFISRAGCFDRTAGALFIICLFFWFYVQGILFSLHFYFHEQWLFT